ncbi:MAG: outer membrane lipoprotein chaperone LolA [Nitrospirae bacterium]|nr:outer membrane lipoprotein chaperone LolA [Nitrospirota bacterium]
MKNQKTEVRSQKSDKNLVTRHLLFVTVFLLVTCYSSLVTVVHAATADEIVQGMQKRFAEIRDVKGSFSQTSYLKDLERTETYSGTFFIKKPSQLMWEYKTPRDEKVIISGTETWIYKKAQKQAIKTKFSKEAYSQVPIALLNSIENLSADFDARPMEKDMLDLVPKHRIGFIKEIHLKPDSKNFPIKTLKVFDTYGNIITIELKEVRTNTKLDDALFMFTPPQGVEVYDMSQ